MPFAAVNKERAMTGLCSRLLFVGFACLVSFTVEADAPGLSIRLEHGSEREKQAEQQLRRLAASHDLAPWTQTAELVIEEYVVPHSHPILTLNTRHTNDDGLLVSTFIHEQMHWWLSKHPRETQGAVSELMSRYKTLPVGYPDGADTLEDSYEHLLVIWLELDGVQRVLGPAEEKRVLDFWSGDHYRVLYRIVREDRGTIGKILRDHGLLLKS
jgi:hypothetical protein